MSGNERTLVLEHPLNELEKKFGNDPTYAKFKASLIAPGKEFMNFLNANRAEHDADIKATSEITDPLRHRIEFFRH